MILGPIAPAGRFEFRVGDEIASLVDGVAYTGPITIPTSSSKATPKGCHLFIERRLDGLSITAIAPSSTTHRRRAAARRRLVVIPRHAVHPRRLGDDASGSVRMISTSIGKYCGARLRAAAAMTSPSAGPSFSSMKRSNASRDSRRRRRSSLLAWPALWTISPPAPRLPASGGVSKHLLGDVVVDLLRELGRCRQDPTAISPPLRFRDARF